MEADVPNLTAVECRLLTEFCLNVGPYHLLVDGMRYEFCMDLMMPNASPVLFKIALSKFFLGQNGESRRCQNEKICQPALVQSFQLFGLA